jgi:hypothetical protein
MMQALIVVKLLHEKNADVNAQGGEYGNALQAPSYGGHDQVVNLLHAKNQMTADGMTKILPRKKYIKFIQQLHLVVICSKVREMDDNA